MEEMKPGRELDAMVAERVMGLPNVSWTHDIIRPCYSFHDQAFISIPHYSTDIAAAWEVMDTFTSGVFNGYPCHANVRFGAGNQTWNAWFAWGTERHEARATSPAEAICLAALKANGTQIAARREERARITRDKVAELEALLRAAQADNFKIAEELMRIKLKAVDV